MKRYAAALVALACGAAAAQSVALQGTMGAKALLIVDGAAPKLLAPGEAHGGVKVVSTSGDQAVVEIGGRRHTLRVGEAPASIGGGAAPSGGSRIVLPVAEGGHFFAPGTINGRQVRFVVDTGATVVGMGQAEAERIGLDWRQGRRGRTGTANGVVDTWVVRLDSVRVGDVEVHGVEASVVPMNMPYILLGNSFLSRFQMTRTHDQMVLERRY